MIEPGTGRPPHGPDDLDPGSLESRLHSALAPSLLLVRSIGSGGMARVFLAREPALKRLVAVKVLSGDLAASPEARARFEREAQAVASLTHPNIVAIHTVGELDDGTPYFVMQYVEGRSMSSRVEQDGPLSVPEARRALGEVAAALAAAHAQGIVHRDVKPANILYEDASGRCLVSDFGIAAMHVEPTAPTQMRLTGTGMIVGTPQYMSPEQLLAEPVSDKTDVYSLGLLAHELLTGKGPFRALSPHELIAAHLRDTPARLSTLRADVDPELDEIVARALQKDASKRPTAAEIAQRLAPGGAALLEWPPPGLDELHGRLRWVSRPWLGGGALVIGGAVAAFLGGSRMNSIVGSAATVLIMIALVVGIVLLVVGAARAVRMSRRVTRAVTGGYAWMTILETLADTRGDSGNVMTASREYASLDSLQRDRVRRWRVIRELALLGAGVVALPLLIVSLALAPGAGPGVIWLSPAMYATLVAIALGLAAREHRLFAARRGRRAHPAESDVSRLAEPWNASFERVRGGQALGRGSRKHPLLARLGAIAVVLLLTLGVLLFLPLGLVVTVGPVAMFGGSMNNVLSRVASASWSRDLALPKDPGITPLAAGAAMHRLLRATGDTSGQHVPQHTYEMLAAPIWRRDSLPPGTFLTTRDPRQFSGLPQFSSHLWAASRSGFSRAEHAYLERIAREPHWSLWDTLSRASGTDLFGARYRLPLPDSIRAWWRMPVPRYQGLRQMAHGSIAIAAWHNARGQRDSAEFVLRRAMSVGYTLIDNAFYAIDLLIGAVIVRESRNAMLELWELTGDPRAPALRARRDATSANEDQRPENPNDWLGPGLSQRDSRGFRAAMVRYARDSTNPRGVRYEVLTWLAISPCTNLRELFFGFDADVDSAFAIATRQLVRYPTDSAFIRLVRNTTEELDHYDASMEGPLLWTLRVAGRALNNPRLAGCTMVMLGNIG